MLKSRISLLVMLLCLFGAPSANAQKNNSNKSASLLHTSSSKLSQSQRNDSIRASKYKGRKTNKSSADND